MVERITQAMVKRPTVPASGRAVTWDDRLPGFGLRVTSRGAVSFVARYWTGSAVRWVTLGNPPKLSLTQARKKAANILKAVAAGGDPVAEERAAETERRATQAATVEALAAEWLAALPAKVTRRGRLISPRTVEQYAGLMKLYILPAFGARPAVEVTRRDVAELHRKVTRRGGYIANRVVNVAGAFYSWAESIEAVPHGFNPCRRPPRNPEQARGEHAAVRLSRDQEGRLVAAIERLIGEGTDRKARGGGTYKHKDPIGGTALLALLDTGRRVREVLGMEWRRLDLDAGTVDLGRTKGKAAGDVAYLTPRVREALRRLPRIVGVPHVFTGTGKAGRRAGLQTAWDLVKREAGLEQISPDLAGFHLHDLRHHRISELLAAGVAPQLVARQVGHTSLDQLRVYSHLEVADVAAVLAGLPVVEAAPAGEVVSIA